MVDIFSSNYLPRQPIKVAVQDFARRFQKEAKVLDIGCGDKPYASFFSCQYIGLDPFSGTKGDIKRDAWDSGLPDHSVDGIVLNQSLEHIQETAKTIAEIKRVLKFDGLVLVTVPQSMRNHGIPVPANDAPFHNFNPLEVPYWNHDFWRFTKFGLIYLFQDFTIESISESNSYLSTLIQLWNYFLASFGMGNLLAPLYFINNICAIGLDIFFRSLASLQTPAVKKFDQLVNKGLTLNYIMIAKLEEKS